MRIGIFTDSYKPYTSGVVTSISTFKEEMTRLGHEVYIFAPSYPNYNDTEDNVFRFFSVPSPTNPDYTLAVPVYPGLNMIVKKLRMDIIHVQSPFTMGRVGLHYARKYNIPLVITYHSRYDQYVHYVPLAQDLAKEVTIKYSSSFCNHCDHVVVPSQDILEIIREFEVNKPITVIPTGIPLYKFEGANSSWLRENYDIPEQNKILLFVGRLTKEKNLPFLIKAFQKIKMQIPDTTLVLTAQGPMEAELKSLCKNLGLTGSDVIFTGALPFETLVDVYHSADLFVFASLTETQGLVVTEAMAAGLPVVAVRASGVQDMVDDGLDGILTNEDMDEFVAAVCKVLVDKDLYDELKGNAYRKAEMMSSRSMALKMEKLYTKLLEQRIYRSNRFLDIGSWFGN
ncbi:Glycosyl transferase, family 1 [Syntrophomonas zehnderi OL-4]|uniref:Glycosyl transferase, family 1 n=1 Tax=Syntrophomonas zehnderi OL-4 TaxID=690567 RepID=A0A0E3W382_9FIRM|nr:glycosyltransferase family 4 protein [Syntrophomonas zehnderi]CFX58459.1 Glycosyl transferase, family 1 [Syntrophomonas zehnderi OL-4]